MKPVRDQVRIRSLDNANDLIVRLIEYKTWNKVVGQMQGPIEDQVKRQLLEQVGRQVWRQVMEQVREQDGT